jgi:hypothetical protein
MYLAVWFDHLFSLIDLALTSTVFPACIFYLPATFFLHVTFRATSSQELPIVGERSNRRVSRFLWTIHPHGPSPTSSLPTVPFYEGFEPCVLGSKCLGLGNCR